MAKKTDDKLDFNASKKGVKALLQPQPAVVPKPVDKKIEVSPDHKQKAPKRDLRRDKDKPIK